MNSIDVLEAMAREYYEEERALLDLREDLGASCPAMWMLRDMLAMMAEQPEESATRFAPSIRRRLAEHLFIDETGDSVIDKRRRDELDHQVQLLVRVLERVRLQAYQTGHWSDAPMTDMCCG